MMPLFQKGSYCYSYDDDMLFNVYAITRYCNKISSNNSEIAKNHKVCIIMCSKNHLGTQGPNCSRHESAEHTMGTQIRAHLKPPWLTSQLR